MTTKTDIKFNYVYDMKEPIWKRQEGEPVKWYNRFYDYYLPNPDLPSAYAAFKDGVKKPLMTADSHKQEENTTNEGAIEKRSQVSKTWRAYEKEWFWEDRRQAKMAEIEERKDEIKREVFRESLEEHYQLALHISRKLREAWEPYLELIIKRIKLVTGETLLEDIPIEHLPKHLRAIAKIIDTSVNAEAHGLTLDRLLEEFHELPTG